MSRAAVARYCLIPSRWTLEDLKNSPACFTPGSHWHLSFREVYGQVEWADCPTDPGSSRIAKSYKGCGGQLDMGMVHWFSYPKVLQVAHQRAILTGADVRGLSACVGEYLASALRCHQPWAEMMLLDIRGTITKGRESETIFHL